MALCIETTNGRNRQWWVGSQKPQLPDFESVASIQADGHELEYIRENFTMLPDCKHRRVVTWYGDHAKFIYANLT